jgi:hypothetical protein
MDAVQLDLFDDAGAADAAPGLNGMYYERATDSFVSYVLGRRHYEEPARRSELPKEWREKTMKERAI